MLFARPRCCWYQLQPSGSQGCHDNPILDTRMFEVEFLDGHTAAMTVNAIAENLFAQVDQDGHRQLVIDEVIDYRSTKDAISKTDGFITT